MNCFDGGGFYTYRPYASNQYTRFHFQRRRVAAQR